MFFQGSQAISGDRGMAVAVRRFPGVAPAGPVCYGPTMYAKLTAGLHGEWRQERRVMAGYGDRITIEPGKRGGQPCIRGMRITVYDILDDFPYLAEEDVRACLAFAADRERRLMSLPAE